MTSAADPYIRRTCQIERINLPGHVKKGPENRIYVVSAVAVAAGPSSGERGTPPTRVVCPNRNDYFPSFPDRCRYHVSNRPDSPRAAVRPTGSGLEHDLYAVVLLVLEDVVAVRRLPQRQRVGDDPGRVDLAALDALQQRLHVPLHVALAGPQGERPVHPGPGGELVHEPAVHADHGDDPAAAAAHDGLAQRVGTVAFGPDRLLGPVVRVDGGAAVGGLHAHRVDALVWPPAAGQLQQRGPHVGLLEVDRDVTGLLGHGQAVGLLVDGDDRLRAEHAR